MCQDEHDKEENSADADVSQNTKTIPVVCIASFQEQWLD